MTKYKKGRVVCGLVTGIESYGIFVSLDEFYNGLIHISEAANGFVKDLNEIVYIGETIYAKVLDVDEENFHVKLSLKDVEYRPLKKKRLKITETEQGFNQLKEQLDGWIDKKMKEIKKN